MLFRGSGKARGDLAETRARNYLERLGMQTLGQNYRCRFGEIDLIMNHGNTLVFVEVRYRKQRSYGSAAETVTASKQRKIALTANHYLNRRRGEIPPCRFDVIAISGGEAETLEWIMDAFQPET